LKKQGLNAVALIINMTMNILRKVVLDKCTAEDWIVVSLFVVLMIVDLYFAVKLVARE